jgi:hypothetical protein
LKIPRSMLDFDRLPDAFDIVNRYTCEYSVSLNSARDPLVVILEGGNGHTMNNDRIYAPITEV